MRPWKSQPLCGMNDVSYDNYCIFENARCDDNTIKIKHGGKCGGKQCL